MIEESAAIGVLVERPALRMDDAARGVLRGVDVPQLLDAKPIDLRLAIGVECELRFEHLGQMAAHAFGKEGIFGMEFEPRSIVRLVAAIARDAHITGRDAFDRTILIVEDFGGGKAREDFDAQPFGRSEEHTSELQSLMRISYAVFCLKKKKYT